MQLHHHHVNGERAMRLGVSGHTAGNITLVQFVPERPPGQFPFHVVDDVRVEHCGHVGGAEQALQRVEVQREQGRAAFGVRLVILVHHLPHIAEHDGFGERRRRLRLDIDQVDLTVGEPCHQPPERGQVVDVLQAFAGGLQQQREVALRPRGVEQLDATQALLPQRHALARVGARQVQRTRRAFAEACGEQHRLPHLFGHQSLDVIGIDREQLGGRDMPVGLRQQQDDAVVAGVDLAVVSVALLDPVADDHRPRFVHALAVRRVEHDPPVALLVRASLHHQRAVGRHRAGGDALLVQQLGQVGDGVAVESVRAQSIRRAVIECGRIRRGRHAVGRCRAIG